ncbi:MAG: DUF3427 domain-containing protein [Eggerthellales bacterium]|nr:DUF3427 domain-containing protein [Eggerthellales bacterium]
MEHQYEQEFVESLRAGFMGEGNESDYRFVPRLLVNDQEQGSDVLSALKEQLKGCQRFDFSVAFITSSGVEAIVQLLIALRDQGIPGRILTTTYNNFNDPAALRKLLEFPNIELRAYQGAMHTKGYFFQHGEMNAVVIGSANLTQTALSKNKEWNVLLYSYEDGDLFQAARREYEQLWQAPETALVTEEWVNEYEAYRTFDEPVAARPFKKPFVFDPEEASSTTYEGIALPANADVALGQDRATPGISGYETTGVAPDLSGTSGSAAGHGTLANRAASQCPRLRPATNIKPNAMQRDALAALKKLHEEEAPRALLISATGTGKTYLSAFDVLATKPKKVLFVAHRKRILQASRESFRKVLGDSYQYGMIAGSDREPGNCMFAMVSTLARHLDEFNPLEFDYIIVDETHRAGAESYRKVLSHFAPKFVLGMTATPNRSDDYDIFDLFNHVIAYRITLQDALREEMLAPFHYYGISDLSIDDQEQDELTLFARLTSEERIRHVVDRIEAYTVDKAHRRGLIFCSRKREAQELSRAFNKLGYRTQALSGDDSDDVRDAAIARLESGELEYLFSVDIFNEGVDIPSVNQVIMLRPTQSTIVFVQQLGRGLRKSPGKESVLVLDFIGNYQNNYMIPIALSGDRTYNKDNLRRFVKEGSTVIPGCSTVSFDRVAEERILEKLDTTRFSDTQLIKGEYNNLRTMLGRIPTLRDFDEQGAIDPLLIIGKFDSYHEFLLKYEKAYDVRMSETCSQMLRYVSSRFAAGKRVDELVLLRLLVNNHQVSDVEYEMEVAVRGGATVSELSLKSVEANLTNEFILSTMRKKFDKCVFVQRQGQGFVRTEEFEEALRDVNFRDQLLEVLDFGIARHEKNYGRLYKDTNFNLYEKYTYEDVLRLFNRPTNVNAQNIGGYFFESFSNAFPVFINYEKSDDISETTMYEDRFVSDRELVAISKSRRTMDSPEIVRLREMPGNGVKAYLFVRKNKNDKDGGKEFYFLGEMYPTGHFREFIMPNTTATAVEIGYKLDVPVRRDIYDYLISDLG